MAGVRMRYQLGTAVTGKAIIGQTLGVDGTFTAGTSYSLESISGSGVLERFGISFQNQTEQIVPMDTNLDNQVITMRTNNIVLEEIIQASVQPRLEIIAEGFDYCSFTFTEFGKVKTYYGVILSAGEEKARGKNVYRMELGPIVMNSAGTPISNYSSA